jgi:hypothetical protein
VQGCAHLLMDQHQHSHAAGNARMLLRLRQPALVLVLAAWLQELAVDSSWCASATSRFTTKRFGTC